MKVKCNRRKKPKENINTAQMDISIFSGVQYIHKNKVAFLINS